MPSRTGSVITTIYGDAILPRGGSLALADLLALMRRLGASDGVVRTAVSRLARDGVLVGRRTGRTSAYALTERSRAEFAAAVPAIYGPLDRNWDGRLHMVFPEGAEDRAGLEAAGFAAVTPGVLIGFDPPGDTLTSVRAEGADRHRRELCARAWPSTRLGEQYMAFLGHFESIDSTAPTPLDAMAARTILLHAYRRLALRTPRLPATMRPDGWIGTIARARCETLYRSWAGAAEAWLDQAGDGSGPLPGGPDPSERFSGGGR